MLEKFRRREIGLKGAANLSGGRANVGNFDPFEFGLRSELLFDGFVEASDGYSVPCDFHQHKNMNK